MPWLLTFDLDELGIGLETKYKRRFTVKDVDYHLRRYRLRRFGETIPSVHYVSDVRSEDMIENEGRIFIAAHVQSEEPF